MIRLSELKLALDHTPDDLKTLILHTLALQPADLVEWHIFKRSFDARKAQVRVVYIVDVTLAKPEHEAALLAATRGQPAHRCHTRHDLPAGGAGPA